MAAGCNFLKMSHIYRVSIKPSCQWVKDPPIQLKQRNFHRHSSKLCYICNFLNFAWSIHISRNLPLGVCISMYVVDLLADICTSNSDKFLLRWSNYTTVACGLYDGKRQYRLPLGLTVIAMINNNFNLLFSAICRKQVRLNHEFTNWTGEHMWGYRFILFTTRCRMKFVLRLAFKNT